MSSDESSEKINQRTEALLTQVNEYLLPTSWNIRNDLILKNFDAWELAISNYLSEEEQASLEALRNQIEPEIESDQVNRTAWRNIRDEIRRLNQSVKDCCQRTWQT